MNSLAYYTDNEDEDDVDTASTTAPYPSPRPVSPADSYTFAVWKFEEDNDFDINAYEERLQEVEDEQHFFQSEEVLLEDACSSPALRDTVSRIRTLTSASPECAPPPSKFIRYACNSIDFVPSQDPILPNGITCQKLDTNQ